MDYNILKLILGILTLIAILWTPLIIFRMSSFNKAAAKFHAAFAQTIQDLNSGCPDIFILEAEFISHKFAIKEFSSNLNGQVKKNFENAWKRYESYCEKRLDGRGHIEYVETLYNSNKAKQIHEDRINEEVLDLINEMLSFAKKKK